MNLRHLETFVKIGQLKSFTRAGEELHLTQPTVSKQMVDLEKFFDIRLIDRTKRGLAFTRAGEILFKYAKEFLALQEETISAIAAFKGLKRGNIRIGASNIPGGYILRRSSSVTGSSTMASSWRSPYLTPRPSSIASNRANLT
jgi:DNA-binding transcriptional LysR family regulator